MTPMMLMVMLIAACSIRFATATAWQRHAVSTDGFTAARMQQAHADGYICWFLGLSFSKAVCIKDAVNATAVPTTARDLRRVLYSVSLQAWLPDLLCSSPPPTTSGGNSALSAFHSNGEDDGPAEFSTVPPAISQSTATTEGRMAGGERCREVVEAALSLPDPSVWAYMRHTRGEVNTFAAMDEVPWVKAMEACLQPDFRDRFLPFDCFNLYNVLASFRGKDQLLPALQDLWQQQRQIMDGDPPTLAFGGSQQQSSRSPRPALSAATGVIIESLLSLLDCDVEKSRGIDSIRDEGTARAPSIKPYLRMFDPKPATRMSGKVVAFIAEVYLGEALEERLREATEHGPENDNGGGNGGGIGGHTALKQPHGGESPPDRVFTAVGEHAAEGKTKGGMRDIPPFRRCEVRVVADGDVTARIPLHSDDSSTATAGTTVATSAAAADEAEGAVDPEEGRGAGGDRPTAKESAKTPRERATTPRHNIAIAVTPDYTKARCSEHPFKAAGAAAGATAGGAGRLWGGWDRDMDTWHLEAREVDRVCTRDASGAHRMHGEVACCYDQAGWDKDRNSDDHEAREDEEEEVCEVWASSEEVEYLHTGLDEPDGDAYGSSGSGAGSGPRALFDPPPEQLSVTLHLERFPDLAPVLVSVPRWSSDGEVWEMAYDTCSEAFGPSQGVLVNLNDCVDLLITSIAAKRADLYHSMVIRLDAYLLSVHPNRLSEAHTGAIPEKVEALGGIARIGGQRVRTVCEVGFNAGHSALNWLLRSDPSVRVLSFDLGEHEYVVTARDFLQAVFPERLELVLGDSRATIPAHTAAEASAGRDPRVCDVIFVDGGHSEEGAYADLSNFRAKTSRGWNALVLDDMELPGVSAAWRRFSKEELEDEGGTKGGTGKGHIDRVVRGSAERYAHAKVEAVGDWKVTFEDLTHRIFLQRGYFSMGVGAFRF